MGDRTKNLTRTPVLILFVILISVGIGTSSMVNAQLGTVPNWFKGVAGFWAEGKLSTSEFLDGIEFLIDQGVIQVPGYGQAAEAQSVDQGSHDEMWTTINSLQEQIDSIDSREIDQTHGVDQESIDGTSATLNSLQKQITSIESRISDKNILNLVDGTNNIQWNEKFEILDTQEDLRVGNTMYVGTYTPDDDDSIWMDSGNEYIMWDNSESRFEISDDLVTGGLLNVGHFDPVTYSRIGGGITEHRLSGIDSLLVTKDLEVGEDLIVDGGLVCDGCVKANDIGSGEIGKSISKIGEARFFASNGADFYKEMSLTDRSFCILTEVHIPSDGGYCSVYENNGRWQFNAGADGDREVRCTVTCFG